MSLQSPDDGPTNGPLQILTPRMYQKRVVDFAIAQNTLAVLPTGSGKTLIAVKLIEHFLSQSYSPRRIVAFLAPTTVLVEQQRLYVQTHCVGIVRSYIGETSSKGVSIQKWGREEWAAEVKEVNVMVMTPEILRDAFSRKLVEVSSFSLVILDEVHNATGSSPMALVCELIHKSEPLTSGEDSGSNATLRPRILGLTASPINNKQSNSRAKIEALLSTTQCKLLAPAEDLEEILTHTPVPDIFILRHGPGIQTSAFASYTSAFKPSSYMHALHLAYLRARHANYLNSFAKLALKLKMPLHHFSQIQPLCLPPTFLAGRGGYLLDMLQQVLHRIYKIAEEGGAFLAIVALQLALEANSQNFLGFSIYKSNQTVNMDRVVQQVAEIQNGPFEVTTLIAYSRVYITSLVDAFVALSLGLPTALRDRFILSLGSKEHTTNLPIMRRLHGILETQNLLGTYNINGGGFLAHVNENYAVAELKSCISECCRLAMRSLRQEDFIACFAEEISIYPYIYNLVNYCDPAVTFSHLANMRGLPEEPSLFSHKLGLTLAYIFQQAEERSGESWACIVFSQLCLTSKAMNAVMALLIDIIRDTNSKEIGRKLELNSRCIVGNDQQSIRNQLECLLSFKAGAFNVLFASSVVEEGIDVKVCDLVINYNLPATTTSLVQRRGRARANNSMMIMLIATTEEGDKAQEGLAEMLKNDLSTNKRKFLDYIFEEEGSLARRDAASYIVASTGACCDSRSALKTLCSHFQKHPAGVLPLFWQIRTSEKTFQCAVLLPPSAPANIRCQISDPVSRKSDAKALVALECVRQLHLAGELDDTLRSPYGLAIPTPAALSAGQEEDEGVDKNIEIKYVPDCLLNSSARMFMYAIHVSHSFEVYNQSRIPTLLTELGNAGLCFPSPLPQGTDAFQVSYRNAVAVDVRLVFLCEREISGEELICMQKFHRALLCWESNGPTPQMQRSGEWDKSSNGANYIMFPLSAEFKHSDGWRNSSHGFEKSWLSFLRTSADAAEDLIKNFFINRKISSTECSPIGFTLGANAYHFSGRLISHLPGFFSYALEEHEISLHSLLHFEKKKEPKRYFDFFLEKDYVCAESLNAMFNKSNHRLVTSIGIGCRLTAESLISSPELMAVDVNHSSKPAHLIPEYCQVVGSLEYYLLGTGLPSLIWRIQSLLLAHECLEHIKSLYTQILSLESRSDTPLQELLFPSPILMLEALTPRLCQENINCERIEMLGDSILKLIIGHELFTMYPEKQEGELTSMRSRIACGLDKYLRAAPFFVGNQLLRFKPPGCSDGADSLWNHNLCSEGGHMVLPEVEKDNFFISSLQHSTLTVKSKRLADLLEALIGAFFLSDGIKGATFICQAAGCWPRSIPAPVILPSPPPLTEKVAETSVIETRPCIPDGYPDQLRRIALNEDSFEYASSEDLFGYAPPAEGACQLSADYIQERIGYRFANPELLQEVFTHPSVSSARRSSYQRLEFLGDAVLDVAVVVLLYASESMHDQGALTTLKSNATNNRKLGTLAITLGLYKLLKFNSETLQNAFQIILIHQESAEGFKDVEEVLVSALDTMADCFEALVGAVYLDSNHSLDTIKQIVLKLGMIDPALL